MFTVIHVNLLSLDILAQDQEGPQSKNHFKGNKNKLSLIYSYSLLVNSATAWAIRAKGDKGTP